MASGWCGRRMAVGASLMRTTASLCEDNIYGGWPGAGIPAATKDGMKVKAGVLLATLEDFAGEDAENLARSLANDCVAI